MTRNYTTIFCIKCRQEFKTLAFNRHANACTGLGKISEVRRKAVNNYKQVIGGFECPHCAEIFSARGISSHIRIKHLGINNFLLGANSVPWNKGKSVKTHPELEEQLRAGGKSILLKRENGEINFSENSKKYWTPERREEKSEEKKMLYRLFPEKHPNRKIAGNRKRMTYPEQVAFDFLTNSQIVFESQKRIGKWFVDFCIGWVIIEIDGERFHPIGNENDRIRDLQLSELGYEVHRIRSKENIEQRIKEIFGH